MGQFGNQPDFATEAAVCTPSDTISPATNLNGSILYVGVVGDVSVIMAGKRSGAITFKNVPGGSFLPVTVDFVLATNTTATEIIAVK
jgi:hypothetical protein|tara:strand:+ start:323 stop:583 length:261 start_codon:yes stop_codon:yes gene_type:complete